MPTKTLTPSQLARTDSGAAQALFTPEALADLQREVAHLRTAVEVLQRQNAELVSIRQAFEVERRRYREMFESAPDGYVLTKSERRHSSKPTAWPRPCWACGRIF